MEAKLGRRGKDHGSIMGNEPLVTGEEVEEVLERASYQVEAT